MNTADHVLEQLRSPGMDALALLDQWRSPEHDSLWQTDVRLFVEFARALISGGHPTRAFELAREGLLQRQGDHSLMYLAPLALVRGSNPSKAWEYLEPLLMVTTPADSVYVDAHSLAGRIKKDMAQLARDDHARRLFARDSARAYETVARVARRSFPSINAATMWCFAGERDRAEELAKSALDLAAQELGQPGADNDYWLHATTGEAHLILGDLRSAATAYARAMRLTGAKRGDIASMRTNVRLLREQLQIPDEILGLFRVGRVVVFAGHMVDNPGRSRRKLPPRFPDELPLVKKVAGAVREALQTLDLAVGYSSVACGSDILFAEEVLARGAEHHAVLPFNLRDFFVTSVDFGLPEIRSWRERCKAVLARTTEVHYATREPLLGAEELFSFGGAFARGLAINHAAQFGDEAHALVVVDPTAPSGPYGAAAFLHAWQEQGRPATVIDLAALREPGPGLPHARPAPRRARMSTSIPAKSGRSTVPGPKRQIKAMLFADVKNFSQLREEQAPAFFLAFLTEVDRTIQRSERKPVFQNTWGDGLYLVFDQVADCADFALRLLDRIEQVDWKKIGLPEDTTVRIGLHAGPVYAGNDPIIGRKNFFGTHVNRAARIEPVTPPSCAFASEQFAAVLGALPAGGFVCDYVGVEKLHKEYDRCPLYRLRRR